MAKLMRSNSQAENFFAMAASIYDLFLNGNRRQLFFLCVLLDRPPERFRSFKRNWFNLYKWLHYDLGKDAAFCFVSCKAVKAGKAKFSSCAEKTFLSTGFTNWQGAIRVVSRSTRSPISTGCAPLRLLRKWMLVICLTLLPSQRRRRIVNTC